MNAEHNLWKNLLRELLNEAVHVEDLVPEAAPPSGAVWEITISDERMQDFEDMGLWNKGDDND
mgnify:CR=1 FL=1|tara:strand:+ start:292 stop:480 length:189 start_codon:yes stop_codon:yes gene_type:complete